MTVPGIESRWEAFDTAPTLVEERFTQGMELAQTANTTAMSTIQQIESILNSLEPIPTDITLDEEKITPTVFNGTKPSSPGVSPNFPAFSGDRPASPGISINMPNAPVLPSFEEVFPVDPTTTDIVMPSIVISEGQNAYDSLILIKLKSNILSDLNTGGTGLGPTVEQAIYDRDSERDLIDFNDKLAAMRADWARSGFPLPNGALIAKERELYVAFTNKRADKSRDIVVEQVKLAFDNKFKTQANAVQLETVLIDWTNKVSQRIFEASKALADGMISVFTAAFQKYRIMADIYSAIVSGKVGIIKGKAEVYAAQVQALRAQIEAEIGRIDATQKIFDGEVKLYGEDIRAFLGKTEAEKARIDSIQKIFEGDVRLYEGEGKIYEAISNVDVALFNAKINQNIGKANLLLKDAEIRIKNYEQQMGLKVQGMSAIAVMAGHLIAGALAGVSAGAHIEARDSASYEYKASDITVQELKNAAEAAKK